MAESDRHEPAAVSRRTFIMSTAATATVPLAAGMPAAAQAQPAVTAAGGAASGFVQYLAGGTTLVDLMKLDVMRPAQLIDITRIASPQLQAIDIGPQGLRIGALATMRQVADHAGDWKVFHQHISKPYGKN